MLTNFSLQGGLRFSRGGPLLNYSFTILAVITYWLLMKHIKTYWRKLLHLISVLWIMELCLFSEFCSYTYNNLCRTHLICKVIYSPRFKRRFKIKIIEFLRKNYLKGRNFRGKKISRISRILAKFAKTSENVDSRKLIPAKFFKIDNSRELIPAKFIKNW